jgi:hypothetical protein
MKDHAILVTRESVETLSRRVLNGAFLASNPASNTSKWLTKNFQTSGSAWISHHKWLNYLTILIHESGPNLSQEERTMAFEKALQWFKDKAKCDENLGEPVATEKVQKAGDS